MAKTHPRHRLDLDFRVGPTARTVRFAHPWEERSFRNPEPGHRPMTVRRNGITTTVVKRGGRTTTITNERPFQGVRGELLRSAASDATAAQLARIMQAAYPDGRIKRPLTD